MYNKEKEDDKFKKVSDLHNIKIFRGSTNNVAKRLIDCAKLNHVEIIVRITGDCPIIDPKLIDDCIKLHFKRKKDYTTNTLKLSFPDGLDVEVFNTDALIKSQKMSKTKLNKEHVTYYMRRSKKFTKLNYKYYFNYSNRRWTLDKYKDYIFLKSVLKYFYPKIYFSWLELIKAEKINKSLIYIKERP